jgi:hypothetical protein
MEDRPVQSLLAVTAPSGGSSWFPDLLNAGLRVLLIAAVVFIAWRRIDDAVSARFRQQWGFPGGGSSSFDLTVAAILLLIPTHGILVLFNPLSGGLVQLFYQTYVDLLYKFWYLSGLVRFDSHLDWFSSVALLTLHLWPVALNLCLIMTYVNSKVSDLSHELDMALLRIRVHQIVYGRWP